MILFAGAFVPKLFAENMKEKSRLDETPNIPPDNDPICAAAFYVLNGNVRQPWLIKQTETEGLERIR